MSNLVFPNLPGINIAVTRRAEWMTEVKEALNGQETAIAQRAWPRWHYTLQFEVLRSMQGQTERQQLEAFFNKHRGRADDFLFLDIEDSAVVDQAFGTGNGSATLFQLVRPIDDWLEPVWAPFTSPAPVIKINGATQTVTTHYTIGTRGQVQFTTAPANGAALTWTGSYYMRVRFADDALELERFLQGLWKSAKVQLISKVYA